MTNRRSTAVACSTGVAFHVKRPASHAQTRQDAPPRPWPHSRTHSRPWRPRIAWMPTAAHTKNLRSDTAPFAGESCKLLKIKTPRRGNIFIPDLEEQIRIIGALVKMKHFDGIWINGGTLSVRRFRDHFEVPEYLPWEDARRMVDVAAGLPEPKTVKFEKTLAVYRANRK